MTNIEELKKVMERQKLKHHKMQHQVDILQSKKPHLSGLSAESIEYITKGEQFLCESEYLIKAAQELIDIREGNG